MDRILFLIKKSILVLIKKKSKWETLFLKTENWKNFELRKGIKISSDKNRFLADPNLVSIKEKYYIFVEDCDIYSEKAKISRYEICEDMKSVKQLGTAIEEDYHISFPFTFKVNNILYISVESKANKTINIYRNGNSPLN